MCHHHHLRSKSLLQQVSFLFPGTLMAHISCVSEQAVSAFFTPASKKAPEKLSWRIVDSSLLVGRYIASGDGQAGDTPLQTKPAKCRVAAFDFDSTIIKTISKAKFARDANDWQWWHGTIPSKLKELHSEGFVLVIMHLSATSSQCAKDPQSRSAHSIQAENRCGLQ
jgi:hypothetical protein